MKHKAAMKSFGPTVKRPVFSMEFGKPSHIMCFFKLVLLIYIRLIWISINTYLPSNNELCNQHKVTQKAATDPFSPPLGS